MEANLKDLPYGTPCYLDNKCQGQQFVSNDNYTIKNVDTDEIFHIRTKRTVDTVYIDESELDIETRKQLLASAFTWGPVVAVHTIGEYQIVEYHPGIYEKSRSTGKYDMSTTVFSTYTNWKSNGHSYESLDHALVGVIDHKYQGPNSQAAMHFMRMVIPWNQE